MDRNTGRITRFTPYQHVALIGSLLCNQLVYNGSRLLNSRWQHLCMELPLDAKIPFLPWSIVIYFGCFAFWAVNYILISRQSRPESDRFFCADILAKLVCLVCFLAMPTTNVRPEVAGTDVWSKLMRLLYRIDAADNLFPSIHCLVSWLCWIGVRRNPKIPRGYRWTSLGIAIEVCFSTLTTRQHVMLDAFAGVALAEGCYFAAGFAPVRGVYTRIVEKLLRTFSRT